MENLKPKEVYSPLEISRFNRQSVSYFEKKKLLGKLPCVECKGMY